MLKILVQCMLHVNLNRLLQYHFGVQFHFCTFGVLLPIQHYFRWHMSINNAKCLCFIDHLFLASYHRQVPRRNFLHFSHSLSTVAIAAGIFIVRGMWIKLQCCDEFSPFPKIWSSWWCAIEFPIRNLVDSSASRIHASLVFNFIGCTTLTIFSWYSRAYQQPRMFPIFFEHSWLFLWIHILRVNDIDLAKFSCVFKVELFLRPPLLLLQLGVLSHWFPELWP